MSANAPPILIDPPYARPIGSQWRRLLAFLMDSLVLYAVGRGIGTAFFNTLSHLGLWGRLLGFCVALAYFATLESGIGGGQTLGKRLLRLRVVNAQRSLIPWGRSAIRYSIFAVPWFFIGSKYPVQINNWAIVSLIIFVTLGLGVSTLYLLVFNRRTRQGLHDVAVGTYVIEQSVSGQISTEPIWRMHWLVISGALLLIAFTALSEGIRIEWRYKTGYVTQSSKDEGLIEKLGGVQTAEVEIWSRIRADGDAIGRFLLQKKPSIVTVQWIGEKGSREAIADQVARIILENDPRVQKEDLIQIEIGRSYDLGIASGNDYQSFLHTPAEWHQRVFGASAGGPPME